MANLGDPRHRVLASAERLGRFLALLLLLNLFRYLAVSLVETPLLMDGLFGAMAAAPEIFNTSFSDRDLATSYLFNGGMWLAVLGVFHLARPTLRGSDVRASLAAFALCWALFASVSGVYMNHYRHAGDFYAWSVLDAAFVFACVALANGVLYRRMLGPFAASKPPPPV